MVSIERHLIHWKDILPKMKNFKDYPPRFVDIIDADLNIYRVWNEDNLLIVRQPRRNDSTKYRVAWKDLSQESLHLYKRANIHWDTYEPKKRVVYPIYKGGAPGVLPLVMEVGGKIVGFSDIIFDYGKRFTYHQIPENDIGASIALCIIDKYQNLGYGSYFAKASELIARHKGAQWALGYTKVEGGMYNIRLKTGWEMVTTQNGYAIIKKNLIPSE